MLSKSRTLYGRQCPKRLYLHVHRHELAEVSWSIKSVIPTIAPDLDYSNLGAVQEGGQARDAYLEAIHPETSIERREAIERDLSAYCERDTFAMVRLAQFLEKRC